MAKTFARYRSQPALLMSAERFAIVTGGGGGIGGAFVSCLAERGWHVCVVDHDGGAAQNTAEASRNCHAYTLDVVDGEGWGALRETLRQQWPRLDLVVNCAGILQVGDLTSCSLESIRKVIDVNLTGSVLSSYVMTPWLKESRAASQVAPRGVINVASIFASVSPPNFACYAASKAGIIAFSESLRGELGPHGLTVCVAVPGITQTGLFQRGLYSSTQVREQTMSQAENAQVSSEEVARQTLAAAERGRLYAVVGRRARLYWRLKRLWPQYLIDRVATRINRVYVPAHNE